MKEIADIVAADITGEHGLGMYTGRRTSPTHDEIAQLASAFTSHVAGRTATPSKIGCVPNKNSRGTTHNGGVATIPTTHRNGVGQAKG